MAPASLSLRPPVASSSTISHASIHPLPLAAILDHHLRRPESQDRVFGTLLGVRNTESGEIEVRSSFGVPYAVTGKDVAVDSDHHRSLLELHHRVSPKEVVVGWYATSSQLNSFSALLQDFYNAECSPSLALHLTLDPTTLGFQTYSSSPVGLTSTLNLVFKPVPSSLAVPHADRTGLEHLAQPMLAAAHSTASAAGGAGGVGAPSGRPTGAPSPLANMHLLLTNLRGMLGQITEYVQDVVDGKKEGDAQVGRFLLETIGSVPIGQQGAKASFEDDFQAHLSDVLMVSYLANLVRAQTEISGRLNLLVS